MAVITLIFAALNLLGIMLLLAIVLGIWLSLQHVGVDDDQPPSLPEDWKG